MARGVYSVHGDAQTVSTAITLLQITAPAASAIFITRVWIAANTTTAGAARIRILRKTGGITGTASPPTPTALDGTASSGATIAWIATAEGTDGNILYESVFRMDGGEYLWLPVPEERIFVPAAGIVAMKFPAAPASNSFSFGMDYIEWV